jgi:integrase
MPRVQLTDRFVSTAKASQRVDYFDEKTPGLALRVSDTHKAWSFNFTSPKDGKRARITIGSYPATSLASARAKAIEARGIVENGSDPRELTAATAATLKALIDSYFEKHVRPRLRRASEIERTFSKNVTPVIGNVRLTDLHRRDINRVIDAIIARDAPVEAARVFAQLRALFRWALARGDIDVNPMDGMKRPPAGSAKDRTLSDDELRGVFGSLEKALSRSKDCQRILRLCALTGQRVGEISGMAKAELDLKAGIWTIPVERSKNKTKHVVPLSDDAIAIIREALKGNKSSFVFPAAEGGSLPARAVTNTVRRANLVDDERPQGRFGIPAWTPHDIRRTVVSGMAKLGIAPIVIAHVVNHRSVTRAGVTFATYNTYAYEKEKHEALELWARHLNGILEGGAVIPMRKAPK